MIYLMKYIEFEELFFIVFLDSPIMVIHLTLLLFYIVV